MKKVVSFVVSALLLATVFALPAQAAITPDDPSYNWERFKGQDITLHIYNWGLYISDGSDGGMDINKEFEDLTGIKVDYTTYDTNESLYAKLKMGGGNYDVIVPSDYMIGKMSKEGMLAKLNFDNIPNFAMIGDQYKGLDYDPNAEYSVPYTWGVVGIVYNKTMVKGTIDSWNALWDEQYKGNVLMFNNSRDAFAIAFKKLGMSLNPSSADEIQKAAQELKKQKGVVQAYVMDEIFDKMEGGEAALAPYYAGDAITMIGENPDLAFVIPKEGTNYFVDAMCVPATSTQKEAAEMYINFMCETQVALANCEFIGYSTPQVNAEELLPDELKNSPIMYPPKEVLANTETFNVLPDELNQAMDEAWSDVKSYDEKGNDLLIPGVLAIAVVGIAVVFWRKNVKKKRNDY